MKTANTEIYLDKGRPKKCGKSSVKIKVTYNRKRKYFSTGIDMLPDDFDKVFYAKRKTQEQKEIKSKIEYFEKKAVEVINILKVFSFDAFENQFLDNRNSTDSVKTAFDEYIKNLKFEDRIGTAVSYECARNSIEDFKKNLTFA